MSIDYKQSGVDIEKGEESVSRIKSVVKETFDQNVLQGLGSFGAMYDASFLKKYQYPVLVQSIDGVGTKVKIAAMARRYTGIGHDIVAHCANDIVSMGARPLTFLDYLAFDRLDPLVVEGMVKGMSQECSDTDISLIGGETAEMPGVYAPGEFDVAGSILGVVEKDMIITGASITSGDVLLGLPSSGLHTNGFSLARKLFFELGGLGVDSVIPEIGKLVSEVLLEPHRNYTQIVRSVLDVGIPVKGMAHITGGGFVDNIPRMFSDGVGVKIYRGSWPVLPIFDVMQKMGDIAEYEMFRTFNMGIGMVLIVAQGDVVRLKEICEEQRQQVYEIGRVVKGEKVVRFE